jgi:hypothetical protein
VTRAHETQQQDHDDDGEHEQADDGQHVRRIQGVFS